MSIYDAVVVWAPLLALFAAIIGAYLGSILGTKSERRKTRLEVYEEFAEAALALQLCNSSTGKRDQDAPADEANPAPVASRIERDRRPHDEANMARVAFEAAFLKVCLVASNRALPGAQRLKQSAESAGGPKPEAIRAFCDGARYDITQWMRY